MIVVYWNCLLESDYTKSSFQRGILEWDHKGGVLKFPNTFYKLNQTRKKVWMKGIHHFLCLNCLVRGNAKSGTKSILIYVPMGT